MNGMDQYHAMGSPQEPTEKELETIRRIGAEWGFEQRRLMQDDPMFYAHLEANPAAIIARLEEAMHCAGVLHPAPERN